MKAQSKSLAVAHGGAPHLLADLMDLEGAHDRLWLADELESVFRHQMSAPVQFDLARLGRGRAGQLRVLCEGEGLLLKSFGDLFAHPHPPLELLRLTQEFAKLNRQAAAAEMPVAVATVLYYASIATALVRCHTRTTRMGNAELCRGLRSILALSWVTDPIRGLCAEAAALLEGGAATAETVAEAAPDPSVPASPSGAETQLREGLVEEE